jgi:hypothetical protein
MINKLFKRMGTASVVVIAVAGRASAILGIGDVVYDPTNYAEAVRQLVQLEQQYQQLVRTYQMVENQYQQMKWMAQSVPVNMINRYRALATPWNQTSATNTYGTTGAWTASINSGLNVSSAYASATEPLGIYGGSFGNIPSDQLSRIKTHYATVELTDGANIAGLQTIGELRNNATQVNNVIDALEADSLSSDPDMNTEIAVLNKINAANIIALRNSQDANKALVALAEQQILQAKRGRDAEARAFNQHIGFMTNGQALMAAQSGGASDAMRAWRMP